MKILAIAGAALVVVAGAAGGVAYWAGGQFERQLHALDGKDLGQPGLRLRDVVVHRGLLSSTAKAILDVPVGVYPLSIPLRLQSSQGLALDGSALRVRVRMGDLADTPLRSLLAAVDDTSNPFVLRLRYGVGGGLKRVALDLKPIQAQIAQGRVQLAWKGMQLRMRVHGFYAGSGGSADGTLHWARVHLSTGAPANARMDLGAIDETFVQKGRATNAQSSLRLTMGPTTASAAGKALRIDSVDMSADLAMHRPESGYSDNPSGLPSGQSALKDLDMKMVLSQPAAGSIEARANLDAPIPGPTIQAGMSAEQIEQANQAYLGRIRGTLDLRASMSLLQQAALPALGRLSSAGYIVRQGADAVSHIVFGGGHVTVNGHLLGS